MSNEKNNGKLIAIITMCFIFAMISFVTNMGAPFGNIWGQKYEFAASWGNLMNFTAYLFMGVPSGMLLKKIGYKKTALYALILGVIGLAVQYLSSIYGEGIAVNEMGGVTVCLNLYIYMLGALICGVCVCMLNTVVNPMLNLLGGGGNKGNQLIQVGGTLNSLTATLTPLLTGVLVGTVTKNTSMSDVTPLLFVGMAVFAISFVIISRVAIPEPNLGESSMKMTESIKGALKFRHLVLGIIAIFFYVGVEIGIPMQMNFWVTNIGKELGKEGYATIGGSLAGLYWLMMLVGRFSSTLISGKISTKVQMTVVSSVAILLLIAAIFTADTNITLNINLGIIKIEDGIVPLSCVFIFLCGLCTSIMWGGIFNLSVEGLGKYTEAASGLFMMMVVGGGLMPWLQDVIAKANGSIASYWLQIAMLAYILFYSVIGCKNVNKDIKVD